MRKLLLAVLIGALAVYLAAPPRARDLPQRPVSLPEPVRGAFHVHTRRSDGSGTVEQVARAAARAGLSFVILTDHGDATRAPDAPTYHGGVLVIDAVEISTDHGHVVALRLPKSPYPLAGESRDVVDDVQRLGGVAIAAHPTSRKTELRWTDWNVPIQGLELANADTEWRNESAWQLARALLAYPVRPAQSLALLLDRDDAALHAWDERSRTRRVMAVAASDAHGRIGLRAQEPYNGWLAVPIPGYEASFRSMSIALPRARLTSDAVADAGVVLDEIAAGRFFSSIDALASAPAFALTATSGDVAGSGGEVVAVDKPVRIDVMVQAPRDAHIALLRDGTLVTESTGSSLEHEVAPMSGAYRVEVRLPGAPGAPPVPWILSNAIYINRTVDVPRPPDHAVVTTRKDVYTDGPAADWTIEHSSASQGAIDVAKAVTGTQLMFRYAISGGASSHPFAALAAPVGPELAQHERLTFRARADRPMRVSVQLRAPTSGAGERWHRSVFVDTAPREITVRFDDMRPRGVTKTPKPRLDEIRSLLFVVDTVNTPAGTAGQLSLDDVRYER